MTQLKKKEKEQQEKIQALEQQEKTSSQEI